MSSEILYNYIYIYRWLGLIHNFYHFFKPCHCWTFPESYSSHSSLLKRWTMLDHAGHGPAPPEVTTFQRAVQGLLALCLGRIFTPTRHHVSRDTTDALCHSSYCIKLYQIVSNCIKLSRTTWINMNQHESNNAFGICCAGSRSRSDGILEGGMPCCESCNGCLFLVVDGLPVDVVKSPPYHILSFIIRIKLRHVTTLKGYFFVILSCSLLVNASINMSFSFFHTAFGLFFQVAMWFFYFGLGPVISSHPGRNETPDDDGPLPSLVWTVNGPRLLRSVFVVLRAIAAIAKLMRYHHGRQVRAARTVPKTRPDRRDMLSNRPNGQLQQM